MRLLFEKLYPYLFGSVLSGDAYWFSLPFPHGENILSASITIGSIFTGFLATSKSIILTFSSPLMVKIRKTSYFRLLLSYIGQGIWSALAFCILSLFGYFLDTTSYPRPFVVIWFFCATVTFLAFFRITHLLLKMIEKE